MDKLKTVINLMAKSATEENKTEEFLETMKALKIRLFSKMLAGEINRADAENLRNCIEESERSVKNVVNEYCNSLAWWQQGRSKESVWKYKNGGLYQSRGHIKAAKTEEIKKVLLQDKRQKFVLTV